MKPGGMARSEAVAETRMSMQSRSNTWLPPEVWRRVGEEEGVEEEHAQQ